MDDYQTIYSEQVTQELDRWKDEHGGTEPKFRVTRQRWAHGDIVRYTVRYVDAVVILDMDQDERYHEEQR